MASSPGSWLILSGVKISATWPMLLKQRIPFQWCRPQVTNASICPWRRRQRPLCYTEHSLAFANDQRLTTNDHFMMNKMIVGNLLYRPIRSLICVVAVALDVTLILLIVGLSLGMVNDSKQRQAGIGADVVVMPPGSSYIVGLTGAPMPIKIGDVVRKLPHVKVVAPVITQISTNGTLEVIAGIDLPSYEALSPFHFIQGGPFQGPDDVLIDDVLAKAKHIKVGDKMEILNNEFRVAGIVAQGKGARN